VRADLKVLNVSAVQGEDIGLAIRSGVLLEVPEPADLGACFFAPAPDGRPQPLVELIPIPFDPGDASAVQRRGPAGGGREDIRIEERSSAIEVARAYRGTNLFADAGQVAHHGGIVHYAFLESCAIAVNIEVR